MSRRTRKHKRRIPALDAAQLERAAFEAEIEAARFLFLRYGSGKGTDAVPPAGEKMLSLIVSPHRLEEALGDLEHGFHRLYQRHGRPHAVRWYYWHLAGIAVGGVLKHLFRWRWLLLFLTSK
jgi:hypothetical protein